MTIDITPKNKKKPLKISYDDVKYTLPGKIPIQIVTAQDSVPRPKVMAGSQKAAYENSVTIAVLAAFIENVLPEAFRNELDMEDIGQVFSAWSEHTGWGKAPSSDA